MNHLKKPMNRRQSLVRMLAALLFTLAAFLFFGLRYPYHIHYQEQLQMFQFGGEYFREVASLPGGLADWCGRFLTQFFYYAWAGAAICALMLWLVQFMTWKLSGRESSLAYALSFIPAAFCWFHLCGEHSIPGAVVALILALAIALAVSRIQSVKTALILYPLLVPVVYLLCGGLGVAYLLAVPAVLGRRSSFKEMVPSLVSALILAVASPLVARQIFNYPLKRLLLGIHYNRYPHMVAVWMWVAAGLAPLIGLVKDSSKALYGWLCLAGMAVLCAAGVWLNSDMDKEEHMCYDFMVRYNMWNRIMMKADRKNPDKPFTVCCLNLALGQTGRMEQHQFDYFQNGPQGLLPDFIRDCTSPLPTAEAYWALGMVNTAQRYYFEAQEAIPDFQKSARCYKRLAETNIVNEDLQVARKYLIPLSKTLFYRKWAEGKLEEIENGSAGNSTEYSKEKALRFRSTDFLFSEQEMDSMLGKLFLENRSNRLALDYLLSYSLLGKDIPRFVECLSLYEGSPLPKPYQEAFLLYWASSHNGPEGLPGFISRDVLNNFQAFVTGMQQGQGAEQMKGRFGKTYWYYYYFRFNS